MTILLCIFIFMVEIIVAIYPQFFSKKHVTDADMWKASCIWMIIFAGLNLFVIVGAMLYG